MIGKLMPQSNRVTFIINERYPTYLSPRMRKVYYNKIVKAFATQCGDFFLGEKVPVSIGIEIREKKKLSKAEREETYAIGHPKLSNVVDTIVEALNGAAFYNTNQVSEIYVTKLNSNEFRIKVDIARG
jgi:Holliday junction resolvase RusA-like endonuclease